MQQAQENAENPTPIQQAQEQVEQARENIQQASEALSESNPSPSQALASGTRAEQQFQETREQLREQSARKFEESLKSMLNEAVDLEAKQKELKEKALGQDSSSDKKDSESSEEQKGGLRSGESGEPKANEENRENTWREQSDRLNRLWDRMEETVAEAEPSEPLLAEKLYESYRSSKQEGLDERMEIVPQLIERGYEEPVRKTLEELETGVANLRKGVEAAADSVLGNEEAGLRRALDELAKAERELKNDLNRADSSNDTSKQPDQSSQADSKAQKDQNADLSKSASKSSQQSDRQESSPSNRDQASSMANQSGTQTGSTAESENQRKPGQPTPERRSSGILGEGSTEKTEGPFTGGNFAEWSDRLREVEESIRDPELRASASSIRQAAREALRESKRHAKEPQWGLVKRMVADPLSQLREAVQLELLKRSADRNAVVPIDRDPVPSGFEDQLRQYYENLSSRTHVE